MKNSVHFLPSIFRDDVNPFFVMENILWVFRFQMEVHFWAMSLLVNSLWSEDLH